MVSSAQSTWSVRRHWFRSMSLLAILACGASCIDDRDRFKPNSARAVGQLAQGRCTEPCVKLIWTRSVIEASEVMRVSASTATWLATRMVDIPAGKRTGVECLEEILVRVGHSSRTESDALAKTRRISLPRMRGPALLVLSHACRIYGVRIVQREDAVGGKAYELDIESAEP